MLPVFIFLEDSVTYLTLDMCLYVCLWTHMSHVQKAQFYFCIYRNFAFLKEHTNKMGELLIFR